MTMTIDKEQISRRGVLAGLGGMSFCLAIGASGAGLISRAEANTLPTPNHSTPGCGSRQTAPSLSTAPAPKWVRAR